MQQGINMSFGQKHSSPALARAAAAMEEKGIVLVAAAGNGGPRDPVDFPARYPQVLAVTATSRRDRVSGTSSQGPEVNLAAPGVRVLSLWPGGRLRRLSGTSMAAAHVTGTAALLLAAEPTLSPAAVRERLCAAAEPLADQDTSAQGHGLVRADRVLLPGAETDSGPEGETERVTPARMLPGEVPTEGPATDTGHSGTQAGSNPVPLGRTASTEVQLRPPVHRLLE